MYIYSAANIVMQTSWIQEKRERGKMENVIKPSCVIEYNNGMGGVDKNDQQLVCFPVMRKYMKGYKKLFFYMFDIALYNSYVLYKKINNTNKIGIGSFRLDIAEKILQNVTLPDYKTR
ncbi:PiggyBac transposable element-derived protein 4, partial [Stegodyphus mimosarum]